MSDSYSGGGGGGGGVSGDGTGVTDAGAFRTALGLTATGDALATAASATAAQQAMSVEPGVDIPAGATSPGVALTDADYFTLAHTTDLNLQATDWTVAFWLWLRNDGTNTVDLLSMWEGNPGNYMMRRQSTNWIVYHWKQAGDTWYTRTATAAMPTYQWHHVALMHDYSVGRIWVYYDGQLSGTSAAGAETARTTPGTNMLQINGSTGAGNYGDFSVADMVMYTSMLTQAQISQCRGGSFPAGMAAHWKFNGDATDSSGNGHDLTSNGSPVYLTGGVK